MDRNVERGAPSQAHGGGDHGAIFEPGHSTASKEVTDAPSSRDTGAGDDSDQTRQADGTEATHAPANDKEGFEVGWDGGDNDPECPRSFSTARKWLITVIVSSCGFCV